MAVPALAQSTSLEGTVERVTFHNPENGFSVVKLKARGRRGPVAVVGTLPAVQPGERLGVTGQWRAHPGPRRPPPPPPPPWRPGPRPRPPLGARGRPGRPRPGRPPGPAPGPRGGPPGPARGGGPPPASLRSTSSAPPRR